MFAGILDDISSIGDDPVKFFSTVTGKAIGNAYTAGDKKTEQAKKDPKQWFNQNISVGQNSDLAPDKSEDFNNIEYQWMKRLQRFSGLNDATKSSEVKLGSIA